jgi:hypothetical protein
MIQQDVTHDGVSERGRGPGGSSGKHNVVTGPTQCPLIPERGR